MNKAQLTIEQKLGQAGIRYRLEEIPGGFHIRILQAVPEAVQIRFANAVGFTLQNGRLVGKATEGNLELSFMK